MSALGSVVQLKSIAILTNSQWDVCTGRRSPAKETVFGSLQDLVAGNEGPG